MGETESLEPFIGGFDDNMVSKVYMDSCVVLLGGEKA